MQLHLHRMSDTDIQLRQHAPSRSSLLSVPVFVSK